MSRNMYYALVGGVGLLLSIVDFSYGLGWFLAWVFIYLLGIWRERFHRSLDNLQELKVRRYVIQLLFTVVIIAVPFALSFVFQEWFSPYTVFAAFALHRLIFFFTAA